MPNKISFKSLAKSFVQKTLFGSWLYSVATKRRIITRRISSVSEFCKKNNIEILPLNKQDHIYLQIPDFFEIAKGNLEQYPSPKIFYCVLNNISLMRDSDSFYNDDYCFNEKQELPYKDYLKFDVWPISKISKKGKCRIVVKKNKNIIEEAISLVGLASNNFYHVIFDLLSRFAYINEFKELKDVPVVFDELVSKNPVYLRLIDYLNVLKHPIIFINNNNEPIVKKLHYFSPCTFSCVYLNDKKKRDDQVPYRFSKDFYALSYIKEIMLQHTKHVDFMNYTKIFLTRPSSVSKRLVNEDEVAEIAKNYGFTLFDPSQFSIEEQIFIFSHAKHIIADEGAALVNLLWCKEGSSIGCIIPEEWHDYNYATISSFSKMKCDYLKANLVDEWTYHKIDKDYFERYVKDIIKGDASNER